MLPYLGGFLKGNIGVAISNLIGLLGVIGALKFEKPCFVLKVFLVPPNDSLVISSVKMNFTLPVSGCFSLL